jgi:hypothetical protein
MSRGVPLFPLPSLLDELRADVVTGVAFFDFQHGQTGVTSNAIELHPILGFRCGS